MTQPFRALIGVLALAGCKPEAPSAARGAKSADTTRVAAASNTTEANTPSRDSAGRFPRPVLPDVANLLGVDFRYFTDARTDRFFLPEIMGGGAAWLDYDGDGWLDLFVTNGCILPDQGNDREHTAHLFRNEQGRAFSDLTVSAAADDRGYGQGACVGDLNNDGFVDVLVTHYGSNRLLRNNGDGTFSDTTLRAGIHSAGWSTSCAFGDFDRDGDLDLYIAHYEKTTIETNPVCTYTSNVTGEKVRGYCGPNMYEGELDEVYANNGDETFVDVTDTSGCSDPTGKGLAVAIADLNNDAWPDVYVANDMVRNFLFWNLGRDRSDSEPAPRFKEDGLASGAALTSQGRPGASMGIGCADYDHNGWLDLAVTNYLNQGMNLYRNEGGFFVDQASGAGLFVPSLSYLGFGTVFFDYDNNGWDDIFVTNGHVLGALVGPPDRMRGQVFGNAGNGHFEELSDRAGPYFYREYFGRGLAFADFTNAGAMSLAVVHQDEPLALLRNDTPGRGNYLGLHLVGTRSNRCAMNARVQVSVNGEDRIAEIVGGGSYLSDNDHRLLIGLGNLQVVEKLVIRWPSGAVDECNDLRANRYWLVREGQRARVIE